MPKMKPSAAGRRTPSLAIASIAAGFLLVTAARATVLDFRFANATDNGHGHFDVTGTGPNYTVTAVGGVVDGAVITGISSYAFADQLLNFPPGEPADIGGIAFSTAFDSYNIYAYTGGPWLIKASVDPIGSNANNGTPLTQFSVSAPEPLTLSVFGATLAGAAAAMRRRRKVSKPA